MKKLFNFFARSDTAFVKEWDRDYEMSAGTSNRGTPTFIKQR